MGVLCTQLIAQKAFIEALEALLINVKGAIFGGERFKKSNDQVIDAGSDKTGFCIAQDGILKASGAEISGHIEASSGTLKDVTISNLATFNGTINSGPIYASNEIQTPSGGSTFASNTLIDTIRTTLNVGSIPQNGSKTINVLSGSFGSKRGLSALLFESKVIPAGLGNLIYGLRLKIIFNDGTTYTFEDTSSTARGKIDQILSVGGGGAGKTLKFLNLPEGPNGLEPGTVYRNGNQLMIV